MIADNFVSNYYRNMGILLVVLVLAGFGFTAIGREISPLDLPLLFHIHAFAYLAWFVLYIVQTSLIAKRNHNTHRRLGYLSLLVIPAMLVTGFMMSMTSYDRGISPIPDTTIQQFMVFPLMDLFGLVLFFTIAFLNRHIALTHKHAMLLMSIAIMDPAVARLSFALGFPPAALLMHIGLVIMVIAYDRKTYQKVHWVTWLGLVYVIIRPIFIFTVGASEGWANLMDGMYG